MIVCNVESYLSKNITGLKLLSFTLQDEYLSIVVSGGLKLFIHDQQDPIFYGHNGFMVAPGLTHSIALEKVNKSKMYLPSNSKLLVISLVQAVEVRLNKPAGMCVENAAEVPFYNFQNTNYFQEVINGLLLSWLRQLFRLGLHKQLHSNTDSVEM